MDDLNPEHSNLYVPVPGDLVNMFLRVTVTVDIPVRDLSDWEAKTLEEAAINQLAWYEDGSANIAEDVAQGENLKIKIQPIEK